MLQRGLSYTLSVRVNIRGLIFFYQRESALIYGGVSVITAAFFQILGLGIAIPATIIIVFNLSVKAMKGEEYQLSLKVLAIVYFTGLLGYAITFGIKGGN